MNEHRRMTPTQIRRKLQGAEPLAPGMWVDREGAMHISIPDLLKHFGLPDTPANRADLTAMAERIIAGQSPETEIIVTEETTDG